MVRWARPFALVVTSAGGEPAEEDETGIIGARWGDDLDLPERVIVVPLAGDDEPSPATGDAPMGWAAHDVDVAGTDARKRARSSATADAPPVVDPAAMPSGGRAQAGPPVDSFAPPDRRLEPPVDDPAATAMAGEWAGPPTEELVVHPVTSPAFGAAGPAPAVTDDPTLADPATAAPPDDDPTRTDPAADLGAAAPTAAVADPILSRSAGVGPAAAAPPVTDDLIPTTALAPRKGGDPIVPSAPSGRDETDPGALRPSAPESVSIHRMPSRSKRVLGRIRALIGLLIVVALTGIGVAAAIGVAVLAIVFVLRQAFGSS